MERPFPAYEGAEPFVFVSYAHDDVSLVYPEIKRLREAGFHIWYDEGISPGSEWSEALAQHIQRCGVFLYFVTPRSVNREHCRRELTFAMEQTCAILAVHLEPTELPPALQLNLSNRQAIIRHEHSPDKYHAKLDRALGTALNGEPRGPIPVNATTKAVRAGRPVISRRATAIGLAALLLLGSSVLFIWNGDHFDPRLSLEVARQIQTIAVTPFEDSSPDSDMRWLAAGLAAQLRSQLAGIEGLSVVPPGAPASAQIGGTVQASPDEVVVLMEMTDSSTGNTLWAQAFTGSADDPMEMQERVLLQIVRVLNRRLVEDVAQPRGQAAQIAWLRHLAQGWGGDTVTQRYWLEQVIAEDPEFAPAYVVLYWTYTQYARAYAEPAWLAKATDALSRAEELGLGNDPGWLLAKGSFLWQFAGEFEQAEEHLRRALIAGGPGHGYAQWMMASGLVREARDYMEQLAGSFPYLPTIWTILSFARGLEGDVAGAYEAGRQASKLLPPDACCVMRAGQYWALPRLGRLAVAEQELERLEAQYVRLQRFPELRLLALLLEADIALAREDFSRAAEVVSTLESEGWHQIAGFLYLVLGDDRASGALEAGAQPPYYRLAYLQSYLRYLTPAQREDPRIRRMFDAMGFTHEWRLELCRLVSTLPQDKGLICDPRLYAMENTAEIGT